MAKSPPKKRTKKYNPPKKGIEYVEQVFLYSRQDEVDLTIQIYFRLMYFVRGQGTFADRTTLLIRLYAAHSLLEFYDVEQGAQTIQLAIAILQGCRNKETRTIRLFDPAEKAIINHAMDMTCDLFSEATLWECARATKFGEDSFITKASDYEYVFCGYAE